MQLFKFRFFIAASAILLSHSSFSQEIISVENVMKNSLIANNRNVIFVSHYCRGVPLVMEGFVCRQKKDYTYINRSTASNVTAVSYGDIYLSPIRESAIPESVEKNLFLIKNCSSTPRLINEEITLVKQSSYVINTSQVLTLNTQTELSADVKLDLGVVSIGGAGKKTATFTRQNSQSNSNTGSETLTTKEIVSETIPAHRALLITAEKTLSNAIRDFSGSVSIDGLFSDYSGNASIRYSSLMGANLPIQLSGVIYGSDFKTVRKTYIEVSLPTDPVSCNNFDVEDYLAGKSFAYSAAAQKQSSINYSVKQVELYNGFGDDIISVIKPHGIGVIQARAKASGNACGIEIKSRDKTPISFMVYGNQWSDWKILDYYTDAKDIYVSGKGTCSDALIELRYQ
ncbi:MAG TPA: hypothetical protein VL995_12915 [Cellvibrio sp.]|nr:hypothetical protein [Cellvibrio sp.]